MDAALKSQPIVARAALGFCRGLRKLIRAQPVSKVGARTDGIRLC